MPTGKGKGFLCGVSRKAASLLVLMSLSVALGLAQLPTATVLGTVRDSTGAVIPGVNVTVRNTETGTTRTTTSGANGSYRLVALTVGSYEVRVEQPGFQAEVRSGLTLVVDQEAVVNFALKVGQIEQTVEVTAEAPVVNTTSGSLGDLVSEKQIQELPINGRNYINLTLMQPGVQENRGGRGSTSAPGVWISVNGAPIRSNNFLLDGAPLASDTNGTTGGATGATLGIEGIREWKIVTNQYDAQYGMRMGSQMTMVSKGGTNDFHGSLFEYLRNSAFDARNFFDLKPADNPNARRLPAFTRNQFGGAFGGPILHDKVFFFATYEGLRERLGKTINPVTIAPECRALTNNPCILAADRTRSLGGRTNPDGNINPAVVPLVNLFPLPNLPDNRVTYAGSNRGQEDYGQIRGDWNISANDMFFVRYTNTPSNALDPLDFQPFIRTRDGKRHILSASDTHIFSSAFLGTFRYSAALGDLDVDSPQPDALLALSLVKDGNAPSGRGAPIITPGSGINLLGPSQNTPGPRIFNTHTWSGDLFYTRGAHSFKFGTLINRLYQNNTHGNQYFGTITGGGISRFLNGDPQTVQAQSPDIYNTRKYRWWTVGNYIQDDFRALPNLTLNLGFRYEFHTTYRATDGIESALRDINDDHFTVGPPFKDPTYKNFSPRFGFAWDVKGNGRTAVRGGFAILYDLDAHGSSFGNMPSAQPPFSSQSRIANTARGSAALAAIPLTLPYAFPTAAASKAVRTIEYDIESPHMLQYSLTVDRQLPFGMGVSLGYAGSRGLNLAKSVNPNVYVPILGDPRAAGQPGGYFFRDTATRFRLIPYWDTIQYHTGSSNSWYNAFQMTVRKPLSRNLQFQGSYAWSKIIDESQSQSALDQGGEYFTWLREHDRGLAVFHVAHALRMNSIYRFAQMPFTGAMDKLLNGWWVSGILSVQTGVPFDPSITGDRSFCDCTDRPNVVAGRINDNTILGGPQRYFDPTAFVLQPAGTLGNVGRNTLIGPGLANLDFSLAKDTSVGFLGEAGKLEFRAELFNVLNRVNFDNPDSGVIDIARPNEYLSTAGQINTTATPARIIQLSLKVVF